MAALPHWRGFSLTEVLVVIGVIAVLIAMLWPLMAGVHNSAAMADSMNNLRQINTYVTVYSNDNRDVVLPSQFDHHLDDVPGHPACMPDRGEWIHRGTWADIIWVHYELGPIAGVQQALGHDYRFEAPDKRYYETMGDTRVPDPLRSSIPNTRDTPDGDVVKPYGKVGAMEMGLPGLFAANNFFNDDRRSETYNGRFTHGQMVAPARSLYLVDSFAGLVIEDDPRAWQDEPLGDSIVDDPDPNERQPLNEVDFRYNDVCLMLFLDGHVEPQGRWTTMRDLREQRRVQVQKLAGG